MKPIHLTPATLYGRDVDDVKLEHALRAVASVFDVADAVAGRLLVPRREPRLLQFRDHRVRGNGVHADRRPGRLPGLVAMNGDAGAAPLLRTSTITR